MIISRTIGAALCVAAFAAPASAQWMHDEQKGAFSDVTTNLAFTALGKYGLGFKCTSQDDLMLVFGTPEAIEEQSILTLMTASQPAILVRVDDESILELTGTADAPQGNLMLYSAVDADFLDGASAATRRIAVAVRVLGEMYHEVEFGVMGSGRAIDLLKDGCGIP